ncbi:uncharacterized protein [Littorina saxatilis]|uniref:uncharacterized protein isoform X2 n=1 Tax=Littorina saxatilis TaxID=31220 RepID=UPI0038B4C340
MKKIITSQGACMMERSGGPRRALLTEVNLRYLRIALYAALFIFAFFVVIPVPLTTKIGGCFLFSDFSHFGPYSNCNYSLAMAVLLQMLYTTFRLVVLVLALLGRLTNRSLLLTDNVEMVYTALDTVSSLLILISACILSAGIGYTCSDVPNHLLCTDYQINGDDTAAHKMRVAEAGAWISFVLWLLLVHTGIFWLFRQGKLPFVFKAKASDESGTANVAETSTPATDTTARDVADVDFDVAPTATMDTSASTGHPSPPPSPSIDTYSTVDKSNNHKSPSNDHKSPSKDHNSTPSKDHKSPSKDDKSSSKDHKSPSKDHKSPSKDHKSPSKDHKSPSKGHGIAGADPKTPYPPPDNPPSKVHNSRLRVSGAPLRVSNAPLRVSKAPLQVSSSAHDAPPHYSPTADPYAFSNNAYDPDTNC